MLNIEKIRNYVELYRGILSKHHIVVSDRDLNNIYQLVLLTFELDDLYDSIHRPPTEVELDKIRQEMIALMPAHHPIGLHTIELVFKAMNDEAQSDLSHSLTHYLSVCGKSIGAQLIVGYLASKICLELSIFLSSIIVKFNDEINAIIRLANDYLDVTVDAKRISQEISQIKAIHFFRSRLEFKMHLYYRCIAHKTRYFLYWIGFRYLRISSRWREYLGAIHCAESVLDFAIKAYVVDQHSGRELGY